MSHLDDPEDFEQTRQDMIELINASADDERGREFLKALAHTLTERLSSKDLPLAERKIERELLDATLTVLRNEEPEPPRKKAVSG